MRGEKIKKIYFIPVQSIYLVLFILIFSITFIINFIDLEDKFSSSFIYDASEKIPADFFLNLMSKEISPLKSSVKEENLPSISRTIFLTATNTWPEDVRTFLGVL